jgi:hypothetical protein
MSKLIEIPADPVPTPRAEGGNTDRSATQDGVNHDATEA